MPRPQASKSANGKPAKPRVPERDSLFFDVRKLLRNVVDGIRSPESEALTQENLLNNLAKLRRSWPELHWLPHHDNIFHAIVEHADAHGEVPSFQLLRDRFRHGERDADGERLPDGDLADLETAEELKLLDAPAVVAPLVRTNYAQLLRKSLVEDKQVELRASLAKLSDEVNESFRKGKNGFDLLPSAFESFGRRFTLDDGGSACDPDNPLENLKALSAVAVTGRERVLELARAEIKYIWADIATAGLNVLLAGGPGSGKTTLLFLLIAARLNLGAAVPVLGHVVTPAPPAARVVVIENEHSEESSARILVKSLGLLAVDDACLKRLVLVSRKNVLLGSPVWADVQTLTSAGLVSDIVIDTLARFAPGDANDEQAQVQVFAAVQSLIEKAPSPETQPVCWIGAHTRKGGSGGVDDVSGSAQRGGQVDVVVTMAPQIVDGKVRAVKVSFPKVREKDADSWPEPVTYQITKVGLVVNGSASESPAEAPIADQVLGHLRDGPKTSNALETLTKRSHADVQAAITELFGRRAIVTGEVTISGRKRKTFGLRAPDEVVDIDPDKFVNGEN